MRASERNKLNRIRYGQAVLLGVTFRCYGKEWFYSLPEPQHSTIDYVNGWPSRDEAVRRALMRLDLLVYKDGELIWATE